MKSNNESADNYRNCNHGHGRCRVLDEVEKAMTNGDKVRQMPDEELASFVYCDIYKGLPWCVPLDSCCKHAGEDYTCEQCMLEWLKEPIND